MGRRYTQHADDELDGWTLWVEPTDPNDHPIACCDCGLVHDFQFRVHEGKVQFRARRNNRATGQKRRKHKQG